MINGLRARNGSDVPFIIGRMVPEEIESGHPNHVQIDAVRLDAPNRRGMVAYVAGPRASYKPEEMIHDNGAGQRELGRRMRDAYEQLAGLAAAQSQT